MSDGYNPFAETDEGIAPPEIDPNFGATGDDGQPTEELQDEVPRSYLDLDEDTAERYVRVKVDGQDIEVPLREALSGYSRTADYTRKTQELAAQRQEMEFARNLQRALQAQPEETLRLLGRQFGVSFDQQPQVQPQGSPPPQTRNPYLSDEYYDDVADPGPGSDPRLQALEERLRASEMRFAQQEADQELRAAIGGLQQRYQIDEATTREVVGRALQRRQGPQYFDSIYKEIAYDRAHAARQQAETARAAENQRREAAKVNASQLVATGGSAAGGGLSQGPDPDRRLTLEEAFALAEQEHGSPFS